MKKYFILDGYFLIIACAYLFTLMYKFFPVGFFSAFVMLLMLLFIVKQQGVQRRYSLHSFLLIWYVGYCTFTCLFYIAEDVPIIVFIKSVSNSLLPIVFYGFRKYRLDRFWNSFLYGYNMLALIGIILLLKKPLWYIQYCQSLGYSWTRLSSCIGSTAMGSLGAIAIIVSLRKCIVSRGKGGKISYIIALVATLLSMQRSAWIMAFVSLIVMHYYIFFKWHSLKLNFLFLEAGLFLLLCFVAKTQITQIFSHWILEHHSEKLGIIGMFSSRYMQWLDGLEHSNWLFGSGYGLRTHKTINYVDYIVADGSWVAMLCEIGMIGTLLFLTIVIRSINKGISHFKELYQPVLVILVLCLQAIGSNVFEYQILVPLLWISIGEIENYSGNRKRMAENENIGLISSTVSCDS